MDFSFISSILQALSCEQICVILGLGIRIANKEYQKAWADFLNNLELHGKPDGSDGLQSVTEIS